MIKKNRHMTKKLDIGCIFLRDYKASFTGREVARLADVSPQTAITELDSLLNEKIVLCEREGRNNRYSLNVTDLRGKVFLQMMEIVRSRLFLDDLELREIINFILPLAEVVIVFGSFAKSRKKDHSDLDMLIINGREEKVREAKQIFPRELHVEFVNWKQFSDAFRNKKALALEIQKDHVIYGNIYKVVEVYC